MGMIILLPAVEIRMAPRLCPELSWFFFAMRKNSGVWSCIVWAISTSLNSLCLFIFQTLYAFLIHRVSNSLFSRLWNNHIGKLLPWGITPCPRKTNVLTNYFELPITNPPVSLTNCVGCLEKCLFFFIGRYCYCHWPGRFVKRSRFLQL